MQIYEKQEKVKRRSAQEFDTDIVQCPWCGHVRQETDSAPSWQCPNCQVAYHKVTEQYYDETHRKESVKRQAENKKKSELSKKTKLGQMGILAGTFSYVKGLGSACAGVAASPFLKILGAGAIAASLGYIIWKLFS